MLFKGGGHDGEDQAGLAARLVRAIQEGGSAIIQPHQDPNTGETFYTFTADHRGGQAKLVKDIQDRLGRVKVIFDPLFKNISESTASTGARDLRTTEFYKFNEKTGTRQSLNIISLIEPSDSPKPSPNNEGFELRYTRAALDVGRSRHLTRMVANDVLTYMTSYELTSGDPLRPYAGALKEYKDQAQWLQLIKTLRINTSVILEMEPAAREYLDPDSQYTTLWQFLIGKWSRR